LAKVLIIEDEPNMILGLKDSCEYEGYEVSVARDGKEGLEKASTEKPDIILLDVMLLKNNVLLTITSLLSILFMTFHLSDDIVRGFEPGGPRNVTGVLIMVAWLFGTLVLGGRRSGYIIMLVGSILGSGVPVVHMIGKGLVGGRIANSSGMFFWVWTLITLQVTAIFSLILSVRGLWSLRRRKSQVAVNGSPQPAA